MLCGRDYQILTITPNLTKAPEHDMFDIAVAANCASTPDTACAERAVAAEIGTGRILGDDLAIQPRTKYIGPTNTAIPEQGRQPVHQVDRSP